MTMRGDQVKGGGHIAVAGTVVKAVLVATVLALLWAH